MRFSRYVNGKTVTREELSALSLATPELIRAVRDAARRSEGAPLQSVLNGVGTLSDPDSRTATPHGEFHG